MLGRSSKHLGFRDRHAVYKVYDLHDFCSLSAGVVLARSRTGSHNARRLIRGGINPSAETLELVYPVRSSEGLTLRAPNWKYDYF